MNKKLNTETTADDLLMLPDIDGIVKDIKGQKTVSGQSKDDNKVLGGVPQMQSEL